MTIPWQFSDNPAQAQREQALAHQRAIANSQTTPAVSTSATPTHPTPMVPHTPTTTATPVPGTNGQTAEQYNRQQITNPSLPTGAVVRPSVMTPQTGELLNSGGYQQGGEGQNAHTYSAPNPTHSTAAPQPTSVAQMTEANPAATYQANLIDPNTAGHVMQGAQGQVSQNAQVQAAQGTANPQIANMLGQYTNFDSANPDPRATVQHQYEQLTNFTPDNPPAWARGAIATANAQMAARGLGSSTMAAGATTGAILQAAMPIAQQDAQVFAGIHMSLMNAQQQATFMQAGHLADLDMANLNNRQQANVVNAQSFMQMDMANLNNRQQASLINAQSRAQAMFSNQAAVNASRQFNATSENQTNQFYDQLGTQVNMYNSGQRNAMSQFNGALVTNNNQFNATQDNQNGQFNATQRNAMAQFNSTNAINRSQFNTQMSAQIDQANAQWLRQINTTNTSNQNQANMVNAQHMFDVSSTAMANELQDVRDRLYYSFTANENQLSRAHNIAIAQMQNDAYFQGLDQQQQNSFWESIGNVTGSLLGSLVSH